MGLIVIFAVIFFIGTLYTSFGHKKGALGDVSNILFWLLQKIYSCIGSILYIIIILVIAYFAIDFFFMK